MCDLALEGGARPLCYLSGLREQHGKSGIFSKSKLEEILNILKCVISPILMHGCF